MTIILKDYYMYHGLTAQEIETSLYGTMQSKLQAHYGNQPDKLIVTRVETEWDQLVKRKQVLDIAALYEFCMYCKRICKPYLLRGKVGGSLILYLLGITSGNPLPPHLYCPQCHKVIWQPEYYDGFDIKNRTCPNDSAVMSGDGHDISWHMFWTIDDLGFKPDIDLWTWYADGEGFYAFLKDHWLRKPAKQGKYKQEILCRKEMAYPRKHALAWMTLSGLTFNYFHKRKHKMDHYKNYWQSVDKEQVQSVVDNWRWAIRSANLNRVAPPLPKPKNFSELLAVFGLAHAYDGWGEETANLLASKQVALPEMICFRDDVYQYLLKQGFTEKDARHCMEDVRKGKHFSKSQIFREGIKEWFFNYCNTVLYLWPKSDAIEKAIHRMRMLKIQ